MVLNQLILLKLFFLTKALLKHHLDGGIRKALTQEQADAKLAAWLNKNGTVDAKKMVYQSAS
jgi:hypothetical protein